MDLTAMTLLREHKVALQVFNLLEGTNLEDVLAGKQIGTLVSV
jgi:uridylate kinase